MWNAGTVAQVCEILHAVIAWRSHFERHVALVTPKQWGAVKVRRYFIEEIWTVSCFWAKAAHLTFFAKSFLGVGRCLAYCSNFLKEKSTGHLMIQKYTQLSKTIPLHPSPPFSSHPLFLLLFRVLFPPVSTWDWVTFPEDTCNRMLLMIWLKLNPENTESNFSSCNLMFAKNYGIDVTSQTHLCTHS